MRPYSEHTSILISLNPLTEKRVKVVCANCLARSAELRLADKTRRNSLARSAELRLADKTLVDKTRRNSPCSAELVPEWRAWIKQAPLLPSEMRNHVRLGDDTLSYDLIRLKDLSSGVKEELLILQLMTIDEALELLFQRKDSFGLQYGLGKFGGSPDIAKGTYETVSWKFRDRSDDFFYCVTGSIYTLRDKRIAIVWKVLWHGSDG